VADNQHVSIGYLRHLASIAPHSADRQHFALVADLLEAQQAEIERLRTAGDALAEVVAWWGDGTTTGDAVLAAWEEARYG
jgi:hypothetical protein